MSTPLSEERTLLTYPPPASTRFLIFLSISVLCYSYIRWAPESWSHPASEHPDAQGMMPFAWWLAMQTTPKK